MIDPGIIATLVPSAVHFLMTFLHAAAQKSGEEIGKSATKGLIEKFKERIGRTGAKDALEDLVEQPSDSDLQAALRVQLKKAIESDSDLVVFLKEWVEKSKNTASQTGINLTANITGDNNFTSQVVGSGNTVR